MSLYEVFEKGKTEKSLQENEPVNAILTTKTVFKPVQLKRNHLVNQPFKLGSSTITNQLQSSNQKLTSIPPVKLEDPSQNQSVHLQQQQQDHPHHDTNQYNNIITNTLNHHDHQKNEKNKAEEDDDDHKSKTNKITMDTSIMDQNNFDKRLIPSNLNDPIPGLVPPPPGQNDYNPNLPNDYEKIKRLRKEKRKRHEQSLLKKGLDEMKQRAMEQKMLNQKLKPSNPLFYNNNDNNNNNNDHHRSHHHHHENNPNHVSATHLNVDFESGEDAYQRRLRLSGM